MNPLWSLLVALLSAWGAFRLGYRQATIAARSLDLNLLKAAPKVGTSIRIDERQEDSTGFPPRYYLVVTIYNAGEFPATKLNGNCKMFSSVNHVQKRSVPIDREFLTAAAPYELKPCRIEGTTVHAGMKGEQEIRFDVDIQFDYIVPKDKPLHYSAKYQYDNQSHDNDKS